MAEPRFKVGTLWLSGLYSLQHGIEHANEWNPLFPELATHQSIGKARPACSHPTSYSYLFAQGYILIPVHTLM